MQKIIFLFTLLLVTSLSGMQSEQERHEATCKQWGKYLIRAAKASQADPAMVYRIAANMRRERCAEVQGALARHNVAAFEAAQAIIACPAGFRPVVNTTPLCLSSLEPESPWDTCHFKFKH